MFNGTVIISVIFAWPGIGGVIITAVGNRDFALIQAGVFVIGLAVAFINIIADLCYGLVDPRIRLS